MAGDSLANAQSAPQKFNIHFWLDPRPQTQTDGKANPLRVVTSHSILFTITVNDLF